jgi:ArsR family transcriptional regulator
LSPICLLVISAELSQADAEETAVMFKALADPVRLCLLPKVASHPAGGVRHRGRRASRPTVSQHLRKQREACLMTSERCGTWVYCWVESSVAAAMSALPVSAR